MYFPLMLLHEANIRAGGIGFGDRQLSAPQAGLMATLAIGIVGGDMPWPLVVVGILFGIGMIMMQVRSPMLVAVGMYLPFETTFAIFLGGVFRSVGDWVARRRGFNDAQKARVENAGVLTASGLIAGEAVLGLVWAGLQFAPGLGTATVFQSSGLSRWHRRYGWPGRFNDHAATHQRRRPERTGTADSDDVNRSRCGAGARPQGFSFVILTALRGLLFLNVHNPKCGSRFAGESQRPRIAPLAILMKLRSWRSVRRSRRSTFAKPIPRECESSAKTGFRNFQAKPRTLIALRRRRVAHDRPPANQQGSPRRGIIYRD